MVNTRPKSGYKEPVRPPVSRITAAPSIMAGVDYSKDSINDESEVWS